MAQANMQMDCFRRHLHPFFFIRKLPDMKVDHLVNEIYSIRACACDGQYHHFYRHYDYQHTCKEKNKDDACRYTRVNRTCDVLLIEA